MFFGIRFLMVSSKSAGLLNFKRVRLYDSDSDVTGLFDGLRCLWSVLRLYSESRNEFILKPHGRSECKATIQNYNL